VKISNLWHTKQKVRHNLFNIVIEHGVQKKRKKRKSHHIIVKNTLNEYREMRWHHNNRTRIVDIRPIPQTISNHR